MSGCKCGTCSSHHYDCASLWLLGFSFGAYVAARLASQLPKVDGLILIAPSIPNMPYDTLPSLPKNTWVLQGEADEVIDYPAVCAWVEANDVGYQAFPQTGHFFHGKQAALGQAIERILVGPT